MLKHLFDELHCSQIVHMNQMKPMYQDLLFIAQRRSQKITINFCHFCHRGGTQFLVLAPTFDICKHTVGPIDNRPSTD